VDSLPELDLHPVNPRPKSHQARSLCVRCAGVAGPRQSVRQRHRRGQVGKQDLDPSVDLVADRVDGFDVLAGPVVGFPVLVALSGKIG
jgi:hypothetical protein